ILHPANVATPLTAGRGEAFVQFRRAPPGAVIVNVTPLLSVVTVLPPRSCTAMGGGARRARPPVEPVGEVVKAMFAAAPVGMVKPLLVAVNPPSTACSVFVPARSILQPANVATPADTATVAFVQVSAAPAGVEGCVMVNATVPALVVVTVLPPRSCTATTGWVVDATPPVEAFGEAVKPILAAVPTETVKPRLVAGVKDPSAACNV